MPREAADTLIDARGIADTLEKHGETLDQKVSLGKRADYRDGTESWRAEGRGGEEDNVGESNVHK